VADASEMSAAPIVSPATDRQPGDRFRHGEIHLL
jgi:hypothetical protein